MGIDTGTIMDAVLAGIVMLIIAAGLFSFAEKPDTEILEETTIDFEVEVTVRNAGNAPALNVPLRLALPREHPPAQYVEDIEISEEPQRRARDEEGNEFIHYSIERLEPRSQKKFTFNTSIRLVSLDFNIQRSKIGEVEKKGNLANYLVESPFIEIKHPDIQREARTIANRSGDALDIAWNTYEWVIDNIRYQQIPGEASAARTLQIGEGGSAEFGNLFVALMRANGIPARRVSGWGRRFEAGDELFMQRFSHGWAEFYLPNYGWIPADLTFGRSSRFGNFAKINPEDVIMTVGEGVHFLERGQYETPQGETEISTDYKVKVKDIKTKNLSVERDVIAVMIFTVPVLFAIFSIYKKLMQRRI